jgi:hypothetical protein
LSNPVANYLLDATKAVENVDAKKLKYSRKQKIVYLV